MEQAQMNAMTDYANSLYQQQANSPSLSPLPKTDTLEFYASRVYWRSIRDFVSKSKFMGWNIEMWEGEGWVSRSFMVRGDATPISKLRNWLIEMAKD